ncbi:MAG: GNAT family N-acetyltransferase [Roseateles sp.]|jgi:GNAT superfamily N-acetyltransferase|nr:N-acetyltransferase [Methylibium sp.]MBY0365582.1 GNAT family N-acetyltransferase [Burkholderiaceae bacterium]|mmetsp:Transcript_64210/g.157982  ORF Transcript_64210/g.157982 Transcript_64210/m.157982 type:complete len:182 (+) Transcript_64210:629-1174(+)
MSGVPELRDMVRADADAVATLHATSWRHTYRGIFTDHDLDHEVDTDRRTVWRARLQSDVPTADWGLAMDDPAGRLVGFAYVQPDHDPTWGDYLDNLHVAPDLKGAGLGRRLMQAVAERLQRDGSTHPLYLWVLDANPAARRFYERLGAEITDSQRSDPLGGAQHLVWRCVWRRPTTLIDHA